MSIQYSKKHIIIIFLSIIILIVGASVNCAAANREIKYICKGTEFETPAFIIKTEIENPV